MIKIESNIKDLQKRLKNLEKQKNFALRNALNATAFAAQKEAKKQLSKKLDRPTPFTVKGVQVERATKQNLQAVVKIPSNRNYMKYQIEGGIRRPKRWSVGITTPAPSQPLNQYGNVPNKRFSSLSKRRDVFVGTPKGHRGKRRGVYQRVEPTNAPRKKIRGRGNTKKRHMALRKWLNLIHSAKYQQRFPFGKIVQTVVKEQFPKEFDKALKHAFKTSNVFR